MFKLLNQPYPVNYRPLRELRKAGLIGLFIGLFLLTFQPFGLGGWETAHKPLKLLGFGVVTFVITAFNFIVWPRLFPRLFAEENWTVGREIGVTMGNILLIAIANRFYLEALLVSEEASGLNWMGMILVTFLIGIFPVTGLVLFNYITQLKNYSQSAAELPVHSHHSDSFKDKNAQAKSTQPTQAVGATVTLVANNEKDTLPISVETLLFIESSDNYCTVVHLKNEKVTKPLLRSSLSRLEKQIGQPHIVRCHRSFVVNLDQVERVTGNAQGYKLHLLSGEFIVPVARQYNESLIAELKAL